MKKATTHFEQIPVEMAKKIAARFPETKPSGNGSAGAGQGEITSSQLTTAKAEYPWQEPYEAAILETDNVKLQLHLPVAEAAVDGRVRELQASYRGTPEEQQAIHDARTGLNVLRRELQARAHETGSSKD
jgi:hypothetical protein